MNEKLFQEDRYKIIEGMIWDTYKKLPITPKLTEKECEVIIAHLNYHKELIERKMKQHKNLYKNFVKLEEENEELKKENEQLKQQLSEVRKESYGNLDGINYYQEQNGHLSERISDLECENEQLKSKIVTLIDKKIKELSNQDMVSLIPRESITVLNELKKVLEE